MKNESSQDRTSRNIDEEKYSESEGNLSIVHKIKEREEKLSTKRSNLVSIWRECSKYALPMIEDKIDSVTTEGKEHTDLYDSTAQIFAEKLTNTMFNFLTPSASKWFFWSTGDLKLDVTPEVNSWLMQVNNVMAKGIQDCNFYQKVQETFLDSTVLGTGLIFTERSGNKKKPVVFKATPVYKTKLGVDFRGEVDTVYQSYEMKGSEIVTNFPKCADKIPTDKMAHMFKITHAIEPSSNFFAGEKKPLGVKKWVDYLVVVDENILLSDITDGFNSFPVGVGMFYKASGDTYGRSPTMRSLANIRSVNLLRKSYLTGTQLSSAPPLQVRHNSIIGNRVVFRPFGLTYVKGDSEIKPLITGARPDIGEATITKLQEAIGDAFYQDMLAMTRKTHQLEAQISSFNQEQVQALSAVFVRMTGMLEVALNRMFEIYQDEGLIPPAPEVLKERPEIQIQYRSQLARAQRQGDVQQILQAVSVVAQIAQVDPQSVVMFDGREAMKQALEALDSTNLLRAKEDIKKIEDAQKEEFARQQEIENNKVESETVRNLS